jgi:hypothetical protein
MNEILDPLTHGLKLGRLKTRGPLGLIPVSLPDGEGVEYLTLGEAMAQGKLAITEVSEGGSVPELKVTNRGAKPVLLMDGEELRGAKQNRVVNATILIPEKCERVIPVSCTERGRWHAVSRQFDDAGVVMARHIRAQKNRSVAYCIQREGAFRSDQGGVWERIASLVADTGVHSRTGAMHDVFREKGDDLDGLVQGFDCAQGQKGLITFIHGEVAGFEIFSSARAFGLLFPKLVRSYAMEALTVKGDKRKVASAAKAQAFLGRLDKCLVSRHPSVGYGEDIRFEAAGVVGSGLLHQGAFVHAAFFALPKERQRRMRIEEIE